MARVNLVHIESSGGKGRWKKFIFRLESILAFCIALHILVIAHNDNAFASNVASIEDIFRLKIDPRHDVARLCFKKEWYNQPFFRDTEETMDGTHVSDKKALGYTKCHDTFVRLGRVAGFEEILEFYQLRRASGRKINIARMGLSRDRRAPTELTEDQKLKVKNHPELVKLRKERDQCKDEIYGKEYNIIEAAKGTDLFGKYKAVVGKINNMSIKLRRERLDQALRDFHDSIDTIEINKQLDGITAADILTQPTIQYELREWATIAKLLSQLLDEVDEERALKIRAKFIRNLSRLCQRQESRWYAASHQKKLQLNRFEGSETEELRKKAEVK
ncbi:MAG: hypothetical protein M1840_001520 [Geoglossum simile]|nr:MAG: hypothetical protein M1840_001520 [Geoglossum simile]